MRIKFLTLIVVFIQGCSVAPDAFLTKTNLTHHDLIATDSRVRILAETEQGIWSTSGVVEPKRILCTEPSPDVATTLANSLGVSISVLNYGSASLSTQQAEGLIQLGERTAAIQLLRDKMYQTCLAYANGAISGTSYSLLMSRLDDAIVTLSLGDGVAGAFGRKLAGLGGESKSKADSTLLGLPGEISKIEEQAEKLAVANKRVDEAEKVLLAHKGAKPEAGKEDEFHTKTTTLENALMKAKDERNAHLELMRSTARSASEASGKITKLEVGGSLSAQANAEVLRDIHAEFLLTDINRDFISACLVELGLREGKNGNADLKEMTTHLEKMFLDKPSGTTGGNYAAAILRGRGTALGEFCNSHLPTLISDAAQKFHEYRKLRVTLNSDKASTRYAAEKEKASVRERELFIDSIKLCKTEFKDDPTRKESCLDQVIPKSGIVN